MTVNVAGVKLQILIGQDNQDWSAAFVSLTIGDPERDDQGLLPIRGLLKLALIANPPESMNPRSSTGKLRFCRGQRVIINLWRSGSWQRHPRGWAYIAKPPLPADPSNPYLDIELVCALDLQRFPQPAGLLAQPQVQYGSAPTSPIQIFDLDRDQLIATCLQKAGAPGSVNTSVAKYPYKEPIYTDPGSGYVEYAGKIAFGGIAALYQDNQGAIRSCSLALSVASPPIATITIGRDEVSYESSEGGETPAERVVYEGTVTGIKGADPGKEDPGDNPDTSNYATSTEYGPAQAVSDEVGTGTILLRRTSRREGKTATGKYTLSVVEEPLGIISSVAYPGVTTLGVSSRQRIEHVYDSEGRLSSITTTDQQPFIKLCSSYWSQLDETEQNGFLSTQVELKTVERYDYDSKGRCSRITTTQSMPVSAILADEELDNPSDPRISRIEIVEYREIRKDEWEKTTIVRQPAILARPNTQFNSDDSNSRIAGKLALYTTRYDIESSNTGQQTPPATEVKPLVIETEPRLISAAATFQITNLGFSERERTLRLETACSGADQLQELAQIQGAVLLGRAQGARIQMPLLDAFIANPQPLQTLAVIETEVLALGWRKNLILYQLDGVEFSHEADRAVVTASLIWLGSREGSLVDHTQTPIDPVFQGSAIIPPYTALALDYSASSNAATPEITIITPPKLILVVDGGLGFGGEAFIQPSSFAISIIGQGGLGLGGFGLVPEATLAEGGLGLGGEVTVVGDLIGQGGLGLGGFGLVPEATLAEGGLGLGGEVTVVGDLIGQGGLGLGGEVTVVGDLIGQGGLGLGGFGLGLVTEATLAEGGLGLGGEVTVDIGDLIGQGGLGLGGEVTVVGDLIGQGGLGLGGFGFTLASEQTYVVSQSSVYVNNSNFAPTFAKLNDNNGTTGCGTNSSTLEWLKADFREPIPVNSVTVGGGNMSGWGGVANFLNNRVIQWSDDDANWTTVITISGVTDSGANQFREFSFTTVTAQYWRLAWIGGKSSFLATTEFRFK